ncbi:YeeE/YedE family protein [Rhodobacteraceae bacterium 2CG4]|uniref:YeeE/YedE family protein n=1 Tax=Halovulum marinum TaxID=2662447 RepID=A0A6L5Z001_9RHOB|nr:YeeE/YedE family protein [Halovulum marinum]MSU89450.1 YeeE/YedE family protein [Halovulum marinum]
MTLARQSLPVLASAAGLIAVAGLAWNAAGIKLALATLVGGLAGIGLYHAAFGFTAAWRRIVTEGRGTGLRAQFLLIALTILVSYPLIAWNGAYAWVQPMNVGMLVGAFMFGAGMQFGGGCGSGTLFTVGGGSTRMVITLIFFIIGTMIGVAHLPFWRSLPSAGRYSLVESLGVFPALAIMLAVLAALAWATVWYERRRHGGLEPARRTGSIVSGPWSPWLGAVSLAVVGALTFVVLNRPWGITQAFGLWGAKIGDAVGVPRESWIMAPWSDQTLARSVFADSTSVMDFGIVLGALGAAGLAGRFAPVWRLSFEQVWTAVLGGLMMGYGARLAYGCNIGGYLGGLASGSLHGWVWGAAAFAGSSMVAWLRMPRPPIPRAARA